MSTKGKHRRPRTRRFTRSIAVAGTGGAALALPLLGAAAAHAATAQPGTGAAVLPVKTVQSTAAVQRDAGARTYTVRPGDCLARIADDQRVSGGWQRLYADNRQAVGEDPALIHPGLKLSLGKKAAAPARTGTSAPSDTASSDTARSAGPSDARAAAPAKAVPATQASTAARTAEAVPAAAPATGYTLPVAVPTVGTGYHVAGSMWSSGYHTGIDFVVPTGTSLKAVGAGTVVSAGWGGAYGNQVVVRLNDGHYAQYAHLSQLSVSAGQTVTAGQQVGLSGATGNVTGPHLHFEIRTTPDYGSDVDPVAYLRSHGVAL
ncbi:peptidoglycan DD-metalloendopeptidase family protein [Streptomyces sp. ATE26]|uniref:M23 family metallopeptidase n=1 Tax=unclassified Streptomyces TaxID=2593676 RepID=UPI00116CDB90|nr:MULTISPECIES: M23 family metallopeptidase [unclassified Streptomyces]MDI1455729.1 peptidoglycan DD-metalloendopeptidase family protein [Streptomyces sp. ATE26]GEK02293.1 peptidase [Streptomyces sp. 1-11]